jgi:hypothetical protein
MSENYQQVASQALEALRPNLLPLPEFRAKMAAWEAFAQTLPQVPVPLTQYFSHGVYLRQVNMPAGTIITGCIHKYSCVSIVLSGEAQVVTDEGRQRVVGPCVFVSPAGVKRALVIITDCVWLTAHPYVGPELDGDTMRDLFMVQTYEQLEKFQREQEVQP